MNSFETIVVQSASSDSWTASAFALGGVLLGAVLSHGGQRWQRRQDRIKELRERVAKYIGDADKLEQHFRAARSESEDVFVWETEHPLPLSKEQHLIALTKRLTELEASNRYLQLAAPREVGHLSTWLFSNATVLGLMLQAHVRKGAVLSEEDSNRTLDQLGELRAGLFRAVQVRDAEQPPHQHLPGWKGRVGAIKWKLRLALRRTVR